MRLSFRLFAVIMCAVALVAGISARGSQAGFAQDESTPCASPVAAPAGSPEASAPASPVADGEQGSQVAIDMTDGEFDPDAMLIRAKKDVQVTVTNEGTKPHSFNVDETNTHTGDVRPGESVTVTINAEPGTYQYYSTVCGERENGMEGTFSVQ